MRQQCVHLLDLNGGNLSTLKRALEQLKQQVIITSDPHELSEATRVIIPGIGHFDSAMNALRSDGLIPVLESHAFDKKTPILGICLGMQLMTSGSDEGKVAGLGWFDAHCSSFPVHAGTKIKSIHNGWNGVTPTTSSRLLDTLNDTDEFFFLHKYYLDKSPGTVGETSYGCTFSSVIESENLFGVQFHPEKSHGTGLQLLANFIHV